ncbi:MAG: prolipoprotein diacylglyceryl transferase, partial [Tissierellia bacterium]|nr:prolipoprotein diacylglyceryl transferase [Tissierellia bacterium]
DKLWCQTQSRIYFYIFPRKEYDGKVFLTYGILYSIGRFFIEGLRTDSLMLGPLRIAQVVSVTMILLCFLGLKYQKKNSIH